MFIHEITSSNLPVLNILWLPIRKHLITAIKALIDLPRVESPKLKHRTFNVNSMSFSAGELAKSIKSIIPNFTCAYQPDYRQSIADSWPASLDDSYAREEWNWDPIFDLPKMTQDIIEKLRHKFKA